MIHFFITKRHLYTCKGFIESWAHELRSEFRLVPYEKWSWRKPLPNGVCIFTDLERLLPDEGRLATKLADGLRLHPGNYSILNEPGHYLGRFHLQRKLQEQGINEFRVWRLGELPDDLKFPIFLRNDLDHRGPLTPLLHSRRELDRFLRKNRFRYRSLQKHLMVIEYCYCGDTNGIFRKYSAMNIAGTLIPRHILFSANWTTKKPDLVTEAFVREEMDFIANFPHVDELRKIFQLAGVDYGRIDYGVRHGRIQVWEINTNPVIVPPREKIEPRRLPAQSQSARQIAGVLELLSHRHETGEAFPFRSPEFLKYKLIQLFSRVLRFRKRK